MTPSPTRGLRHVALKVRDLPAMEAFYEGVLGYRVEWRPDPENVYLTNGEDSLALHVDADAVRAETRLDHMGVLVGTERDVDVWAAHLTAHGGKIAAGPKTHRDGCRSFYALDPEENRIQFLFHPALSSPR
ncbi:MAG TPA: VOC family protein [Polyangiaceae bacterium]|nr:VOC family protein [Polyangiaceae bacterium]